MTLSTNFGAKCSSLSGHVCTKKHCAVSSLMAFCGPFRPSYEWQTASSMEGNLKSPRPVPVIIPEVTFSHRKKKQSRGEDYLPPRAPVKSVPPISRVFKRSRRHTIGPMSVSFRNNGNGMFFLWFFPGLVRNFAKACCCCRSERHFRPDCISFLYRYLLEILRQVYAAPKAACDILLCRDLAATPGHVWSEISPGLASLILSSCLHCSILHVWLFSGLKSPHYNAKSAELYFEQVGRVWFIIFYPSFDKKLWTFSQYRFLPSPVFWEHQ